MNRARNLCPACKRELPGTRLAACPACKAPLKTAPLAAPRTWYYQQNKQKKGPIKEAELKKRADDGALAPTDMVMPEGTGRWQRASEIPGLFRTARPRSQSQVARPPVRKRSMTPWILAGVGVCVLGVILLAGGVTAAILLWGHRSFSDSTDVAAAPAPKVSSTPNDKANRDQGDSEPAKSAPPKSEPQPPVAPPTPGSEKKPPMPAPDQVDEPKPAPPEPAKPTPPEKDPVTRPKKDPEPKLPEPPVKPAPEKPEPVKVPEKPEPRLAKPPKGDPGVKSYWLGRKTDPAKNEFVFDVPVPPDFAALILCSDPRRPRFAENVKRFTWEDGDNKYSLVQNHLLWQGDMIEKGMIAYMRMPVDPSSWTTLKTSTESWKACKEQLKSQIDAKNPLGEAWRVVKPIMLEASGATNPKVTLNLDASRPYDVYTEGPTRLPQIVPVIHQGDLYLACQLWSHSGPVNKISIVKTALADVGQEKLGLVREVSAPEPRATNPGPPLPYLREPAIGGSLLGFTVDKTGTDYVLGATMEDFGNNATPEFVNAVHKEWRKNVLTLFKAGKGTDLNAQKYTSLTFYGMGSAGSGRLTCGPDHVCGVFARRHFSAGDNLIHQEANDFVVHRDLKTVPFVAGNVVSHSFDQRVVFDGTDFVTLHHADAFPFIGVLIEKVSPQPVKGAPTHVQFPCYSSPILGNDCFIELGGLAAERDGYPVLFCATRNTEMVTSANVAQKNRTAWDLAMVYVVRNFEKKKRPANVYDITGSGILAPGFSADEEFKVEGQDPPQPRTIKRRVLWLTDYPATTRATRAKFGKVRDGEYIALWEEHVLKSNEWCYATTRAMALSTKTDRVGRYINKGAQVELPGIRLHAGDDAVMALIDGKNRLAWVTAGDTNRRLRLHTLDAELAHQAYSLRLPD